MKQNEVKETSRPRIFEVDTYHHPIIDIGKVEVVVLEDIRQMIDSEIINAPTIKKVNGDWDYRITKKHLNKILKKLEGK